MFRFACYGEGIPRLQSDCAEACRTFARNDKNNKMNNKNIKLYIIITVCLVVILSMWFYTLKLNLLEESDSSFSFKEIWDDIKNIGQEIPPMPELTTTADMPEDILDEVADRLKDTKIQEIDTSDWQTYRNEELGFEFKYPEGWEIRESFGEQKNQIEVFRKVGQIVYSMDIAVMGNPSGYSVETWVQNILDESNRRNQPCIPCPAADELTKTVINGNTVWIAENLFNIYMFVKRFYFNHKDNGFIVTIPQSIPHDDFDRTMLDVFDQVLSTFNFLD